MAVPMPLAAAQILWINLVADGLPNIALTMEPKEKGIMQEPPRSPSEPVVNREMRILILVISVLTGCVNLIVFLYYLQVREDLTLARTVVFTNLAIDSLLYVFSVRSLRRSLFDRTVFQNPWLMIAVLVAFVVQLAALYMPFLQRLLGTVPLGWAEWGVVVTVTLFVIVSFEFTKFLFRFFSKKPQTV
jgi:Ca2+-transporting ATPase